MNTLNPQHRVGRSENYMSSKSSVTEKVKSLRMKFEREYEILRLKFESDVGRARRGLIDSIVVRSVMTGKYSGMLGRLVSLSDESCYATARLLYHAVSPTIRIEMCDGFCLPSEVSVRMKAMVMGSSLELRREFTKKLVRVVEANMGDNGELWNLIYLELIFES
jgi:hypothetical protein